VPHRIIMKLVYWPLMGGLLYLVQRGGDWEGLQPAQASPRCNKCNSALHAVTNVTAHLSTASVPVAVLLYNDLLLCGFNAAIKG